jgi:hypothetical protein
MDIQEVLEKIAEIDARIKAERVLRARWTAFRRALEADAELAKTRKDKDDE